MAILQSSGAGIRRRSNGPSRGGAARPAALALATLAITALCVAAADAGETIRFDHLGTDDGLSQVSGNAVVQDRHGFLWIGTQDGLNRYDGYDVKVFKSDTRDPNSLWDNFINGLWLDRDGDLWILPNAPGALTRYDLETGSMRRFMLPHRNPDSPAASPPNPRALWQDERGRLWVGTFADGIFILDLETGDSTHLFAGAGPQDHGLTHRGISHFFADRDGTLWVATFGGGLFRRTATGDPRRERFEHFGHDPDDPTSLPSDGVGAVFEDSAGDLWVGTFAGLARFDRGTGRAERFTGEAWLAGPTVAAVAGSILEAPDGALWVLTTDGWTRLAPDRRSARHYRPEPGDTRPTGNPSYAYQDSHGTLWAGTNGGGLYVLDGPDAKLQHLVRDPADPDSLSSNFIGTILEDASGLLWIGTNNGGLSSYSRHKHRFQQIRNDTADPGGLRDTKIFSVLVDDTGAVWAGTVEGGAHRFDADRRTVEVHYSSLPGSPYDVGSSGVRAILQDRAGVVWIGTTGGGLSRLDPETGQVSERYVYDPADPTSLGNDQIQGLFEDSAGRFWVATGQGLDRLDRDTGTFERLRPRAQDPTSLPGPFVRFVEESPRGFL
ncbi:MAG: two-component regulator propeller domain-containing protein, partial [Acidobacteriota bacterium]